MSTSSPIRSTVVLVVLVTLGSALLLVSGGVLAPNIEANERRYEMRHLDLLISPGSYDNAPVQDMIVVQDADLLGGREPRRVFRARRDGVPVALAIETVAPIGYSGPIHLLVAIAVDGTLKGVEVIEHRETVGLGDRVESRNSNWTTQFTGRYLGRPPIGEWGVKRDGGAFDQFTGATVTPRAVVEAVRDVLIYFEANQAALFATSESVSTP